MVTTIEKTFAAAEGSDKHEKKLCKSREEAARMVISRARQAAKKILQRSYAREEERYKTERKIRAGLFWARLANHLMPALAKEKKCVAGPLGGPRRKPSASWMNEQVRLHESIVKGQHYRLAQQFLWGAKHEKSEVLLKLVQADKTDSKQTILVTPGYSKLAFFHYERETRLGNHTEARAWLIEAIYRAHLWDVKESAEWAEYFATAGRTGVHAAHTSSELQSLLGGVEGNLVQLLAGTEPFEYHEVKTTGTARLNSNAGSVWTTIHPRDAHSVFGRLCTDPDRKYTVVYTRRGGLCLWGHAHVTKGEPYTFYGEVGSARQIAEPTNPEEHQRSQRGDYSHRHAIHGASYLLCGKFATPATPSGAGQWANHPANNNVPATLEARRYAVRYTDSSGAKRVFYVLVLAAAEAQGHVELTHAYTDRFPGVWMFVWTWDLSLVFVCVLSLSKPVCAARVQVATLKTLRTWPEALQCIFSRILPHLDLTQDILEFWTVVAHVQLWEELSSVEDADQEKAYLVRKKHFKAKIRPLLSPFEEFLTTCAKGKEKVCYLVSLGDDDEYYAYFFFFSLRCVLCTHSPMHNMNQCRKAQYPLEHWCPELGGAPIPKPVSKNM